MEGSYTMSDATAYGVVRLNSVRYHFAITLQGGGEFTQEQATTYRDVFKAVANKVISGHEAIIRASDELNALRTVYCGAVTSSVVIQLQLSSIRDVPEALLTMVGEIIVRAFSLLVDIAVGMIELTALGIVNGTGLISSLAGVSATDRWNGDMAATDAAFEAFLGEATASGAFDDKL